MARSQRSRTSATPEEDKASSGSNQDLSRSRRRKRKAGEDSDELSLKLSTSNLRENTGANTNSGPSTSVQDSSESRPRRREAEEEAPGRSKRVRHSDAPIATRTRRRWRTRAVIEEESLEVNPEDDPVLALRGSSIKHFRTKYLQLEKIGQGGFGSVFAGVRRSDNLPVAIKRVAKTKMLVTTVMGLSGREYTVPSEVVLMLRAGGDNSSVGQNAAISLIEWFELKRQVIIVMEKPEDCTNLRDFMCSDTGPLSEAEAKDLIRNVILGTMDIMSKGVFHRDLKCENILIQVFPNKDYTVRIVDFGCSSELEDLYEGFYAGTFEYAPPELYSEGRYQADSTCVWQMGALLYELLNTDKLFNTHDYVQRKLKFKRGLSKDCCHFLKCCLKLTPGKRPPLNQLLEHPWF